MSLQKVENTLKEDELPQDSSDFKAFIITLLQRAKIGPKWLPVFTDVESMKMFELAFTHSSFDEMNNYELVELIGDGVVNASVTAYLREWDPNIISVKYLTRLKHNITSKKDLALMAEKAGFYPFIKIGAELYERFAEMTPDFRHGNRDYMSLLEDCFEAFVGTLKILADSRMNCPAIGFVVGYRFVKSFLQELTISLKYEDVFDAKTRYKELCDRRKWEFGSCFRTRELFIDEKGKEIRNPKLSDDTRGPWEERDARARQKSSQVSPLVLDGPTGKRRYETTVMGYPFGSQKKEEGNKLLLAKLTRPLKTDAENDSCEQALRILKSDYSIFDIPPNPYHRKN